MHPLSRVDPHVQGRLHTRPRRSLPCIGGSILDNGCTGLDLPCLHHTFTRSNIGQPGGSMEPAALGLPQPHCQAPRTLILPPPTPDILTAQPCSTCNQTPAYCAGKWQGASCSCSHRSSQYRGSSRAAQHQLLCVGQRAAAGLRWRGCPAGLQRHQGGLWGP